MKLKIQIVIIVIIFSAGLSVLGFYGIDKINEFKKYDGQAKLTQPAVEQFINDSVRNFSAQIENVAINNTSKEDSENITTADIKSICNDGQANLFDCYETYYKELMKTKDVQAVFQDLRARYDHDGYVVSQCHPLTHVIGNAAVKQYGTVREAYAKGDSFCWSGYYHGVMEGIASKIGPQNIISQISAICSGVNGKTDYSFDYYNCVHGLGHGIMALNNNELFDALKICDNLNGNWEKTSCHSGVFMENVIVDGKDHFTKYLKPEEPLYPCNAVDEKYKGVCYLMQTSYMLKVSNGNFNEVFALCEKADAGYLNTCFQSLGRDASGSTASNVAKTKAICELGKNIEVRSNCIIGAVKDFISYFHSDVQAKELCNEVSEDTRQVCHKTATNYYKIF